MATAAARGPASPLIDTAQLSTRSLPVLRARGRCVTQKGTASLWARVLLEGTRTEGIVQPMLRAKVPGVGVRPLVSDGNLLQPLLFCPLWEITDV